MVHVKDKNIPNNHDIKDNFGHFLLTNHQDSLGDDVELQKGMAKKLIHSSVAASN